MTAVPPCPMCGHDTCTDPTACLRATVAVFDRRDDPREVRGLTDDMSEFVLTPAGWHAKYGRTAA